MRIIKLEHDKQERAYVNVYQVEEKDSTKTYTLIDSTPLELEDEEDEKDGR